MIQRGDICWFRFSSPDKRRPVVLGLESILPSLSQIPVIPISSQIRGLPWEVALSPEDGVPYICVLKPEWIRSVERTLLGPHMTSFPAGRWPEVRAALLNVLGFEV